VREEPDGENSGVLSVEAALHLRWAELRPAQTLAVYCDLSWIPTSPILIA
jgi:hypothetical protein